MRRGFHTRPTCDSLAKQHMLDCAGKSNGICKVLEAGSGLRLTSRHFQMIKSRALCPRRLAGSLRHKVANET